MEKLPSFPQLLSRPAEGSCFKALRLVAVAVAQGGRRGSPGQSHENPGSWGTEAATKAALTPAIAWPVTRSQLDIIFLWFPLPESTADVVSTDLLCADVVCADVVCACVLCADVLCADVL